MGFVTTTLIESMEMCDLDNGSVVVLDSAPGTSRDNSCSLFTLQCQVRESRPVSGAPHRCMYSGIHAFSHCEYKIEFRIFLVVRINDHKLHTKNKC